MIGKIKQSRVVVFYTMQYNTSLLSTMIVFDHTSDTKHRHIPQNRDKINHAKSLSLLINKSYFAILPYPVNVP